MADSSYRNPRAPRAPGLVEHCSALLAAQLRYLRARLKLAGMEGKEAGMNFAILLGMVIGGLVALIFGYFLLIFALVFLIALAFDSEHAWIWVLLSAAVLHLAGAAALVFMAKGKLSAPFFPLTLEELKKDQAWLKTPTRTS